MMNRFFTLTLFFLSWTFVFSQEYSEEELRKEDSLWLVVNSDLANDSAIVKAYTDLAGIYYLQEPLRAIDVCTELEKFSVRRNHRYGKSEAYAWLGYLIHNQGDVSRALEYFVKSLEIRIELGNKDDIANSYNNIGFIYEAQGDKKQALYYFFKALELRQELGNKKTIADTKSNIGVFYIKNNNPSKGIVFVEEALDIRREIGDSAGLALSYSALGDFYQEKKQLKLAEKYFKRAIDINLVLNNKLQLSQDYNSLGELYSMLENIPKAISFSQKSYHLSEQIGYVRNIKESSLMLYRWYKERGEIDKALYMHEVYVAMNDSINSQKALSATIKLKAKQEYDKKMLSDSLVRQEEYLKQQADAEKQELIIAQQKSKQWFLYIGLGLVALFGAFMYNRFRVTNIQKNIIAKQKAITEKQKQEITNQHLLLEETHSEIKDSINYAKRLQTAILPSFEALSKFLSPGFVLFLPKDVVSGDFYWFERIADTSYIAAADCTGHGVPGAMVSIVCSSALNRAVKEFGMTEPARILDKTRELVIETFAKSGEDIKDGMDIAFCAVMGKKVVFSGAGNPLWVVTKTSYLTEEQRNNKRNIIDTDKSLIEYKGDKQPIGSYQDMKPFSQVEIIAKKGDVFYLFTDGYADQFGGSKGKKFKYRTFKKLLLEINHLDMIKQDAIIEDTFKQWKGENEQVDDVCVIGFKF